MSPYSYYLTIRIEPLDLREAVIADVTSAWGSRIARGEQAGGFDDFFYEYCLSVERRLGPYPLDSFERDHQYQRIWSEHARTVSRRATSTGPAGAGRVAAGVSWRRRR